MASNIQLRISTVADLQGVQQLKKQLQEIQTTAKNASSNFMSVFSATDIQKTTQAVATLDRALESAFDVNLGTINIDKFNQSLKKSNTNVGMLYKDLSRAGIEGQKAFLNMTQATMSLGNSVKHTNALVDKMALTLKNTVMWGISSGLWNAALSTVSKSYTYIKGLDKDLNDIRIVTGKSADQMERFAKSANNAAKDLAVSTRDYTQGALIYYQQGDDDQTVQTKTEVTAKAANVTGQDMSTVSEQLTAVWNGYQVANEAAKEGMQVYEEYVDKMAAVGATTASDLEELATAMSKVASAASSMGVGFDELNAQIATIVSVTRQAPESVGTALKTIYARLGDLQVDGVDEFGTSLGQVSSQLKTMGVEVVDSNGVMRDMDVVMTEVAGKWNTWTDAQRQAAAVAMAGKRQYNNLIALFDNWDMYGESLETSLGAAGTLTEQQGIAVESLDKKLQKLSSTSEKLYGALFDVDSIGGIVDGFTSIIDMVANLTEGLGGLKTILPIIMGMMLKTFSGKIGESIANTYQDIKISELAKKNDKDAKIQMSEEMKDRTNFELSEEDASLLTTDERKMYDLGHKENERQVELYDKLIATKKRITEEDQKQYDSLRERQVLISQQTLEAESQLLLAKEHNDTIKDMVAEIDKLDESKEDFQDKRQEIFDNTRQKGQKFLGASTFLSHGSPKEVTSSYVNAAREKNTESLQTISDIENNSNDKVKRALRKVKKQDGTYNMDKLDSQIQSLTEGSKTQKELKKLRDALKATENSANDLNEAIENTISEIDWSPLTENLDSDEITTLQESFRNLVKEGNSVDEAFQKLSEEYKEYGSVIIDTIDKTENAEQAQANLNDEINQISEKNDLEQQISNLTSFAGGATQVWAGLTGVMSAFSAAQDSSLSSTEKMHAAMSGLLMSIPILVSGFSAMNTALLTLTGTESFAAAVKKIFNKETWIGISARISETAATLKAQPVKWADVGSTLAETAANQGLLVTLAAMLIAYWPIVVVIGVLVAAIAGLVYFLVKQQEALEKNADALKENVEEQEKATQAAKEQKDAIDALVDSYKDLQEQYENGDITLAELREKVVDLCLQYDQQDLAIRALSADYEELNRLMKEAQGLANTEFQSEIREEQSLRTEELAARLKAESKGSMRDGQWLDIQSGWGSTEVYDILKDYIDDSEFQGKNKVTYEAFAEALTKNYDEIITKLNDAEGKGAANLLDVIGTDNIQTIIDAYKEDAIEEQSVTEEVAIEKAINDKDIENVKDYYLAVEQATDDIKEYYETEEKAREKANDMSLKAIGGSQGTELALDYEIATKVAKKQGKEINENFLEDISNQLEDFSNAEKNFLLLNINTLKADEELQAFLDKYGELIKFLNEQEIIITIDTILKDKDKTELTTEEIDTLYNKEKNILLDNGKWGGIEEVLGFTKEQFSALDFEQQRFYMSQYYTELLQNQEKANGALKEAKILQTDTADAYENAKDSYTAAISYTDTKMEDLRVAKENLADAKKARERVDDSGDRGSKDVDKADDAVNAAERAVEIAQAEYEESQMLLEEAKQNEEDAYKANNDAIDKVTEIESKIKSVKYSDSVEYWETQHELARTSLKNFADDYKSLVSAMTDYNETGIMTVDTLDSILSLGPEMLEILTLENGQLKLNENSAEKMAQARINSAKAALIEQYQTKLLAISKGEIIVTDEIVAQNEQMVADAIAGTGDAALKSSAEILAYNQAKAGITGFTSEQQKAANAATEEFQKMMAMYDELDKAGLSAFSGDFEKHDEDIVEWDEEFDRYWELNKTIEATTREIEKLQDVQDNLFGKELQNNIDKVNKKLEQQIKDYEALYKEQQKEESELRSELSNMGVDFFEGGGIANYEEATKAAAAEYVKQQEVYNAGGMTDEQYDAATEVYENFKDSVDRYDALFYEEMIETTDKISEAQREILANNLESFEVGIEFALDTEDFERELNDMLEQMNTDITAEFEDIGSKISYIVQDAFSFGESFDTAASAFSTVEEEIKKITAGQESSMFESLSQAQDALKKWAEESVNQAQEVGNAYSEAYDTYLEGISQASEGMADISEQYAKINEELEHQTQLVGLLYGDEAYDLMSKIYKAQVQNNLGNMDSLRQQAAYWKDLYNAADEGTKEQAELYELWQDAESSLNDAIVTHIELLQNEYQNTISSIIDNLKKETTKGLGLEKVSEEWDYLTRKSEGYFDSVQRIYELGTLENTWADAVANTSSTKNQQKLAELMETELSALKDKTTLSEYDVELSNRKLEIYKAQIALEEAQQNKNSMKLMRGTDGNWSYQYVADQDDISSKQQELMDKQSEYYNFTKNEFNSVIEEGLSLQEEFYERIAELKVSDFETQEEYDAKLMELKNMYYGPEGLITLKYKEAEWYRQNFALATVDTLKGYYLADQNNFAYMTEEEKKLVEQLNTAQNLSVEDMYKIADQYNTLTLGSWSSAAANIINLYTNEETGVQKMVTDAISAISTAFGDYTTQVDEGCKASGEDWENVKGAIADTTKETENLNSKTEEFINNTQPKLQAYKTDVDNLKTVWGDVSTKLDEVIKKYGELSGLDVQLPDVTEQVQNVINAVGQIGTAIQNAYSGAQKTGDTIGQGETPPETPPTDTRDYTVILANVQTKTGTTGMADYGISSIKGIKPDGTEVSLFSSYSLYAYQKRMAELTKKYPDVNFRVTSDSRGGISEEDIAKGVYYDTGGYTGAWGPEGKLAVLHEKEIVLNKEDTANMLQAINQLRYIQEMNTNSNISNLVKNVEQSILEFTDRIKRNSSGAGFSNLAAEGGAVYNITAEFPNANDVNEIREAILSLPNWASQYVGSKK